MAVTHTLTHPYKAMIIREFIEIYMIRNRALSFNFYIDNISILIHTKHATCIPFVSLIHEI